MHLLLVSPRGFCGGVVRAIKMVEEALKRFGAPIYVRHDIVHNRFVIEYLKNKGVIFVEDLREVPKGFLVIYSAHGVSPKVRKEAKKLNLKEMDATCPLVEKIHTEIKKYAEKGYKIILIGKKKHEEVIGAKGEAEDSTIVVSSKEEVAALTFSHNQKLFCTSQTTFNIEDVNDIKALLLQKFPKIKMHSGASVCCATYNRQMALKSILPQVDLVLVVGDAKSSNSRRLQEIAARNGCRAYLVNNAQDIQKEWLKGVIAIGMTAGASTPEELVQNCIAFLQKEGIKEVKEFAFVSKKEREQLFENLTIYDSALPNPQETK